MLIMAQAKLLQQIGNTCIQLDSSFLSHAMAQELQTRTKRGTPPLSACLLHLCFQGGQSTVIVMSASSKLERGEKDKHASSFTGHSVEVAQITSVTFHCPELSQMALSNHESLRNLVITWSAMLPVKSESSITKEKEGEMDCGHKLSIGASNMRHNVFFCCCFTYILGMKL